MTNNVRVLAEFMEAVWNQGDATAVDRFLGDRYVIHSDPGDPWDGKTLSRDEFKQRLITSRAPFPDLRFDVSETIADGDRVAIVWTMRGHQTGAVTGRPPTGRAIEVQGMTVYYFADGRITGHRQVVDRLTAGRQLGMAR
jgi:steroid delta-isomerase-like uncharacterized protein